MVTFLVAPDRAASPVPLAEAVNRAVPSAGAPPAPMTLQQKRSLVMEFESRRLAAAGRARRHQRVGRARAERSATQPITPHEVAAAAAFSAEEHATAAADAPETPASSRRRSLEGGRWTRAR